MQSITPALPDQPERDRILGLDPADLSRSFTVEAGAGSGKTTALIGRLLALVEAGGEYLPGGLGEVVAITFTRKAASELRAQAYRRFAARAAELAETRADPSDAVPIDATAKLGRVRSALSELDAACIDTIHGFCGRLLRADALAVGLPPDFSVVEDREADELRRAFWRRYTDAQHGAPTDALASVGLSPADVEPLFAALIRHADRLPVPYGAPCPDLAPAVAQAVNTLEAWQAFRPSTPLGPRDDLQKALDRTERLLHMRGAETPLDQARILDALMGGYSERGDKGKVTLNRWAERGSPHYDRAKALRDEEVPSLAADVLPRVRAWEAHVYDRALSYARDAVAEFAAERRRDGTLTFDDVLQTTADLLRRSPAARRRAATRYRRFFVDEFQDTDPVQAEVLFLLTAENEEETDWRRCRPRPGSLFLVGDPKQSIYRFRRADIETYEEARRLLGSDAHLRLTSCFRSLPGLCEAVNARLRTPFHEDRQQGGGERRQAAYTDLRSARPDGPSNRTAAPALSCLDTEKVGWHSADAIAEQEAESIATFVRAAVDGNADPALYEQSGDCPHPGAFDDDKGTVFGSQARYGDFLVLCRAASRFSAYAAAFERFAIPYALAGDKGLGDADELRALVDLLDAVRDPLDGVARLAQRTGLLGGLDAPTLFGLYVETLDDDAARALAAKAADDVVEAARDALESLPLASALERIVTESGLLAWAARRSGGSDRAGGLLKLLSLARDWEAEGLHWTEALDHLRALLNGETRDGRITLEEGARDAVRIMTVHQAKGLEAPVVFLADPYSGFNPEPEYHVGRSADGTPFATVPLTRPHTFGTTLVAAPQRWHESDVEEAAKFESAEDLRLAYVAATRARGLLVVSRYTEKAGEGPWGPLHADLDAAPALDVLRVGAVGAPSPRRFSLDLGEERRRATLSRVRRPSYYSSAVTDAAYTPTATHATSDDEFDDELGYGSAYGTAIHRLFEWAVRNRDTTPDKEVERALASRLWADYDVRGVPTSAGLDTLAGLRASDLWSRLLVADEVHVEVPVAGKLTSTADSIRGEPTLLRGTIDLAFRDGNGWHLVDFKTDVAEAGSGLVERYASQLQTYSQLWTSVTGSPPASLHLWSTPAAMLHPV